MHKSEIAPPERAVRVLRSAWLSLGSNVFLLVFKLLAGMAAHSAALLSDAAHSASDALSSLVVLLGLRLSAKSAGKPGAKAAETVAALLLSAIMLFSGVWIARASVLALLASSSLPRVPPGGAALAAAGLSAAMKELLYRLLRRSAEETDSPALMAEAWHHRSDALSSLGAFAGVLGARRGLGWCEPAAEGLIALLILGAGCGIIRETLTKRGKTE